MPPRRIASILLAFGLIVGIPGCFVLFPLDEYQEGPAPLDAGLHDATALVDAGSDADAATSDAGSTGRLIFVTSAAFAGNFASLVPADAGTGNAGGDLICTELARGAGLPGSYTALVSDTNAPAKSRLTDDTSKPARPIVDTTGAKVASTIALLFQNGPQVAVNHTESGDEVAVSPGTCNGASAALVWTGSNATGGRADANPCSNWKNNGSGANAQVGLTTAGTKWLNGGCGIPCNNQAHLYCLQE